MYVQSCFRLLTDRKIKNEEEAFSAMQVLHDKGPSTVVLSSTDIGDKDILVALASTVKGEGQQVTCHYENMRMQYTEMFSCKK